MKILMLLSLIFLYVSIILFPIRKEKNNIILSLFLNFVFLFMINSLVIWILSFFNIKSIPLLRSIIFTLIALINILYCYKEKRIQNYYFKKRDVLVVCFIFLISFMIGKYRFGNDFSLTFETSDPAVHYVNAIRFYENNVLNEKVKIDYEVHKLTNGSSMFFSYTSLGTIFQLVSIFSDSSVAFINTFIIFELFILGFLGLAIYYAITKKDEKFNILNFLFKLILIFVCLCGYPLNNLIFGFHYLGICILIITLCFIIFERILEDVKNTKLLIVFAIFAFNIFTSYYLFVPVLFGGCGLTVIYEWLIRKKIKVKDVIKVIGIALVIPFLIGMFYYFIRVYLITTPSDRGINPFKLNGYIYRNLMGNFIILFIIVLSKIVIDFKEKKQSSLNFSFIVLVIFILGLFILFYNGIIENYYYYKLYFLLWPICFCILGQCICNNKLGVISKTFILFFAFILYFEVANLEEKLHDKNVLLNPTYATKEIADVFYMNEMFLNERSPIFTKKQLKELESISKEINIKKGEKMEYYGDYIQKLWFYNMTQINPNNGESKFYYEEKKPYDILYNDPKTKYVLCNIGECDDISNDYYTSISKNNYFELYKKNDDFKQVNQTNKNKK